MVYVLGLNTLPALFRLLTRIWDKLSLKDDRPDDNRSFKNCSVISISNTSQNRVSKGNGNSNCPHGNLKIIS